MQEKRLHRQQSGSSATEIAKVHEIHPDLYKMNRPVRCMLEGDDLELFVCKFIAE